MTQEQIHNLFKQGYNQANWKKFLGETFANARLLASPETLIGIDTNVAKQALKLGYILLNENGIERQIAVYEVTLAKGIILERNRVGLRNLLRKYWTAIDAAFIVYQNTDASTSSARKWRFTYVSELTGYDSEGEFVKIKTEPKRYTYVLGEGESCRTAAERFALIAKKANQATLDDVKEAFSVEKLSKAFFDEYKKHYDIFCDFMVSKPNIRQTIFNGDEKGIRDFNKKLLGRIVFLYFIQKKGWLGVPVASKWGEGDFNFLSQQFENFRNKDLFYQNFLSILFFETLNQKRENDLFIYDNSQFVIRDSELIKIPYLNGGLFEEDDKKHRNLIFPDTLFNKLFNFFNQYNFTIYEDDPNDHTVAVDPEMLGHIFENLLEDNKDKGAYYTPKEIVHYMCQESLIEYLFTNYESSITNYDIEITNEEAKNVISDFIKKKEINLSQKFTNKKEISAFVANLNQALDLVKICDPAIGSGAFPMGLLLEIFTAKQTLHHFEFPSFRGMPVGQGGFDASAVKLNIIQNSIYGVDIEKGAVDIARLRFWLSLIVDEPEPKALPNLDYKIVVGNSLVSKLGDDIIDIDWSLNETSQGLFGADLVRQKGDLLKKISKEQKEYFNPASDKKKLAIDIRNLKIDLLINQLQLMVTTNGIEQQPTGNGKAITKQTERYLQTIGWKNSIKDLQKLKNSPPLEGLGGGLHFFDWKLDFPEVLNEQVTDKAGFDIVIANPPYIKEYTNRDAFEGFRQSPYYQGKMDIWYGFACKMFDHLKQNGIECFIAQNNWITSAGASILRDKILQEGRIKIFTDFGNYKVFNSAGIQTMVHLIKKENTSQIYTTRYTLLKNDTISQQELINVLEFNNASEYTDKFLFEFNAIKYIGKSISFNKSNLSVILDKIVNQSNFQLTDKEVIQGLVGAPDKAFVIKNSESQEYNKKERELLKKYYTNASGSTDEMIFYLSNKVINSLPQESFPNLYKRLIGYNLELKGRREVLSSQIKWFHLQWPRNEEFFKKGDKIIAQIRSPKPNFYFTTKEYYVSRAVNVIMSKRINLKYLSLLLNSNLTYFYYKNRGASQGNILKFDKGPLLTIPIKLIKNTNKFETYFDNLLQLKEAGKATSVIQNKIDNLVYKLYELTYDEVKVIDPAFSLSKKEYEAIKLEA